MVSKYTGVQTETKLHVASVVCAQILSIKANITLFIRVTYAKLRLYGTLLKSLELVSIVRDRTEFRKQKRFGIGIKYISLLYSSSRYEC